jgi:Peptidase family C25/Ricin-type beta-trefoil lectin domain
MTRIDIFLCAALLALAPLGPLNAWGPGSGAAMAAPAAGTTAVPARSAISGSFATRNGLCLDAGKANATVAASLGVAPCTGRPEQIFAVSDDGRMTGPDALCVDVTDAKAGLLGLVICDGASTQHWALRGQHLVGAQNRCLVTVGDSPQPGTAVRIDACDRNNDIWTLDAQTELATIGGNCLGSTASGTALGTVVCSNSAAQQFRFTTRKEIVGELGRCLEAAKSGSVGMAVCSGDGRQKWTLEGREVRNGADLCLDVVNGRPTAGAAVRVAVCAGTQGQQWFAPAHYNEGMATLLVVTDAKMKAAAEPLVAHKNATGMPAALVTVDELTKQFLGCYVDCPPGTDLASVVKRGIDYFYRYRGTKYVFLAGDSTHVPVRYATHHDNPVDTPAKNTISYRATDLYYANLYHHHGRSDLAGGFSDWDANHDGAYNESRWLVSAYDFNPDDVDGYPDVAVGRLDVSQPGDLAKYVQKIVAYETLRMNATTASFFADEAYGGADQLAKTVAGKLAGREGKELYMIEHHPEHALPSGWKAGGAAELQEAAANSNFIVYIGHGGPVQWGHDSAVISTGVVGKMLQANLPIVFGIGCETGAYTPDYRKFSLEPRGTLPPPPQPYNAFSNWWLAHAGWDNSGRTGGAIAYAGEPLVMPDQLGTELVSSVMERYSAGEKTLGDIWRAAQQSYWHAHLNTRKSDNNSWPFAEPRVYLGIMTLFGDPSLRLQRDGGPTR